MFAAQFVTMPAHHRETGDDSPILYAVTDAAKTGAEPEEQLATPSSDVQLQALPFSRRLQVPILGSAAITMVRLTGPTLRYDISGVQQIERIHAMAAAAFSLRQRGLIPLSWWARRKKIAILSGTNFDAQWAAYVTLGLGLRRVLGSSRAAAQERGHGAQHGRRLRRGVHRRWVSAPRYVAKLRTCVAGAAHGLPHPLRPRVLRAGPHDREGLGSVSNSLPVFTRRADFQSADRSATGCRQRRHPPQTRRDAKPAGTRARCHRIVVYVATAEREEQRALWNAGRFAVIASPASSRQPAARRFNFSTSATTWRRVSSTVPEQSISSSASLRFSSRSTCAAMRRLACSAVVAPNAGSVRRASCCSGRHPGPRSGDRAVCSIRLR